MKLQFHPYETPVPNGGETLVSLGETKVWRGFASKAQRHSSHTAPTKGVKVKTKNGHKSDRSPFNNYLIDTSYTLPPGPVHLSEQEFQVHLEFLCK